MKRRHAGDHHWRKPTGDTQHLVTVQRGERTCLQCGDTFAGAYAEGGARGVCVHCGSKRSVPTVSYLRTDEYRIAQ